MEILPSVARAGEARSFGDAWPGDTAMAGADVLLGDESACALAAAGSSLRGTVLVTRVTRVVRSGTRVWCRVDGVLPRGFDTVDLAWPGARLAGATMADVELRDGTGLRRTVRAEVPVRLDGGAPLLVAVRRRACRVRVSV
ncbi:hypothetical protein GCM10023147_22760 [Tsukamurella soli]|uniref:Uncharacterized protein n=2 Tax=Tsukamurella soli TaxID=644556 RepID=A0ABP8JLN2_9ACTN